MIQILVLLLMVSVIAVWRKVNKSFFGDFLSPFNLLLPAWVVPLFLRGLALSDLMEPWSTEVSLLVLYTGVALVVPCFLLGKISPSSWQPKLQQHFRETAETLRSRPALVVLCVFFAIGFGAYLHAEFISNPVGVPLLAYINDPSIDRNASWRFGKAERLWSSYPATLVFVVVPMMYLAARVSRTRGRRWTLTALAATYPMMCVFKMSRIDVIQSLLTLGMIEMYLRVSSLNPSKRWRLSRFTKKAFIAVPVVIVLSFGMAEFRRVRTGEASSLKAGQNLGFDELPDSPISPVLAEAYIYVSLPFDNFAVHYTESHDGINPGIGFFRPLMSVLGLGPSVDSRIDEIGFDPKLGSVNTYPFITLIYAELGVTGILIVPLIYSFLMNILYFSFRNRPSLANLLIYTTTASFAWLWLFCSAAFTVLTCYLYMVEIFVISLTLKAFAGVSSLPRTTAIQANNVQPT